jgi:hypothetical protein
MTHELPFTDGLIGSDLPAENTVMQKIRQLYIPDVMRVADAIETTDISIVMAPAGYGKSTIFIPGLRDELVKRGYQPQALDTVGNRLPPQEREAKEAAEKLPTVRGGVIFIDEWPQRMLGGSLIRGGMEALLETAVPKGYKIVLLQPDRDQVRSKGNRLHNEMDSVVEASDLNLSVSSMLLEQMILPREIALEFMQECNKRSKMRIDLEVLEYMVDVLPRILRVLDQASWWGHKIETKIDFALEILDKEGLMTLECDDCGISKEEMEEIKRRVKKDIEDPNFT